MNNIIKIIKDLNNKYVSIHIRRTDLTNHLKHIKARELKENKDIQKRYKAQRAGAPDNKVIKQNKAPLYIHDAVKRENDKKIKPSHLKSTTNPNKVIKSLQGKIDAMREIQKDDTLPKYKKGI